MKAIVTRRYGPADLLKLEEWPRPIPREREVLVRVAAASVNAGDWHVQRASPFLIRLAYGFFRPKHKVPGLDVAGTVEAVGPNVQGFQVGDVVFGDLSKHGGGAFAEYAAVHEDYLAKKPDSVSFETAAAVPVAGMTALQALRDTAKVAPGHDVLVNGASGGVGSFAVQLAKHFGAGVTAVCSRRNLDKVRALGADETIDYTREDFTRRPQRYDAILDAAAYRPMRDHARALKPTGTYVLIGGSTAKLFATMIKGGLASKKGGKSFTTLLQQPVKADLEFLASLLAQKKLKPLIDRTYALSDVPKAVQYVEDGHTQGKVVIKIASTEYLARKRNG
jgi:NADPH:quinone reductase-like Zn-dependent oxidoreductase